MKYLDDMNVLTEHPLELREGRSCVTNLLSFYSRALDVLQERDCWVDCVYFDPMKACDKVPHKQLLGKLQSMGGLRGITTESFPDVLGNRGE